MNLYHKKAISMLVIFFFCVFSFQVAGFSKTNDDKNQTINKTTSGVIEQQSDWDQPVKKKKSILPFVIGGILLAGGIVAALFLLKKKNDPRGTWNVQLEAAGWEIEPWTLILDGSSKKNGTFTLPGFGDDGNWTLNKDEIRISAILGQFSSDFVLTGTIDGDTMSGDFNWPDLDFSGTWTAQRVPPQNDELQRVNKNRSVSKTVKR